MPGPIRSVRNAWQTCGDRAETQVEISSRTLWCRTLPPDQRRLNLAKLSLLRLRSCGSTVAFGSMPARLRSGTGVAIPSGYETLLNEARAINPHAAVWFGGSDRPPEERGIRVLGTPLSTAEFVRSQLDATEAAHQLLLQRIPAVQDLKSAWLLLLFCASSRATFYLRVCHPDHTEAFARQHDLHTWQCLSTLLGATA